MIATVKKRRDHIERARLSVMPLLTYLNLGLGELAHTKLTVELAHRTMKYPKGISKNVLVELRRDKVNNLMPTIEEGEVVKEFRSRNDARMVSEISGYPSDCDHDKKIRIDCAHNLKYSYMIDFAVLEDMDAYRDEGMGDVIFGEPFLREVGINARWFEGIITIYNGNEEITYQIMRSHPRFKRHTNEQCNKILPLLKVSEEDKMNEISHSFQKLKSFYKEVLNLGPEYVRDAKMEE
nr:glycosyl transferase, family 8 [Tanacetum cinerariifolium]